MAIRSAFHLEKKDPKQRAQINALRQLRFKWIAMSMSVVVIRVLL